MTNYDLEEVPLLEKQLLFTFFFIITFMISMSLTYNQILKHRQKKPLYSRETEQNILVFNRLFVIVIVLVFLYINVTDKKVRQAYDKCDVTTSNLQIAASVFPIIGAIIVLIVALRNVSQDIEVENPEI